MTEEEYTTILKDKELSYDTDLYNNTELYNFFINCIPVEDIKNELENNKKILDLIKTKRKISRIYNDKYIYMLIFLILKTPLHVYELWEDEKDIIIEIYTDLNIRIL